MTMLRGKRTAQGDQEEAKDFLSVKWSMYKEQFNLHSEGILK